MANTYSQLLFHIVFSTKNRRPVLHADRRDELFKYIWGIHKNHQCHLYRIGGVEDHLHILTHLPTTLCIADFVREVKASSSRWISEQQIFAQFDGWQDGYAAFTASWREKDKLIDYIKNQEEHHRREAPMEELRRLLKEAGIEFDEKYLS
ncbi:MAG: IS200/IS605 family transposase [Gemmatales bacterium]